MIEIPQVTLSYGTFKPISKEEIQDIINEQGYWKGISDEYSYGSVLEYEIHKEQGKYSIKISFGENSQILVCNNFDKLEDAYIGLSYLTFAYLKTGRTIGYLNFPSEGNDVKFL